MKKLSLLLKRFRTPPKITQTDIEQAKEELYVSVAKLKKLRTLPEWKEYTRLVNQYIDKCYMRKLKYNFALAYKLADDKTFREIAFLDNDIDFAKQLLNIPDEVIADAEELERQQEAEKEEEAYV